MPGASNCNGQLHRSVFDPFRQLVLRTAFRLLYDALQRRTELLFMVDESRVTALKAILDDNPNDAFARYALGLEYSGDGDADAALAEFERLLAAHPGYTNGYFMAAQVLERTGRFQDARNMLEQGIASAKLSNNRHALAEMEAMLEALPANE